jgi:uncharacterized protein (DUF924 family)
VRIHASASRTKELQIRRPVSAAIAPPLSPERRRDSQISRLRLCAPKKFRKEKCADAEDRKEDEAFVEHQLAELIQEQGVRNRFRGSNQEYARDCVEQSKKDEHELGRRQILRSSGARCQGADKEEKQREKGNIACRLLLDQMKERAHDL